MIMKMIPSIEAGDSLGEAPIRPDCSSCECPNDWNPQTKATQNSFLALSHCVERGGSDGTKWGHDPEDHQLSFVACVPPIFDDDTEV